MAMTLRMEDRLQGAQNFVTWKERVTMVLDVNDVLDHVDDKVAAPIDAVALVTWKKGEAKAKSILLYGVKDHIIPHLTGKNSAKEMWVALNDLYQSKNENMVMVLKERLRSTNMDKGEGVVHYLTQLTRVRDKLLGMCYILCTSSSV
jgi:hypothetical protein